MSSRDAEATESKFELMISYLLVVGVMISLVLVASGMVVFYLHSGFLGISHTSAMFLREQNFFYFLLDLFRGGGGQDIGLWLITLGIAVLILTPYARVILSFVYFILERDWKYTLFTLFVLVLLTVSLTTH